MHELVPGASLAGQVLLDGEDIYDPPARPIESRRRIGMVFQKANPFPTMSVYDNVARRAEADRAHGAAAGSADDLVEQQPAQRRAVGRGEGAARHAGLLAVRRPAAAALHRPRPRGAPRRAAHGRAVLGARPDLDPPGRGDHPGDRRRGHGRDRHPQHAAGPAGLRPVRVLPRRRGPARPHRRAGRRPPTSSRTRATSAPPTTSTGGSDEHRDDRPGRPSRRRTPTPERRSLDVPPPRPGPHLRGRRPGGGGLDAAGHGR